MPGRCRAVKLRAAVDTCCDWSVLRKAALDITLVVGWLMLLAHPPTSPPRTPSKGVACNLRCSREAAWRLARPSASSLTPQQVLFCGFAVACEPSFMRLVRFQQQRRLAVLLRSVRDLRTWARPGPIALLMCAWRPSDDRDSLALLRFLIRRCCCQLGPNINSRCKLLW